MNKKVIKKYRLKQSVKNNLMLFVVTFSWALLIVAIIRGGF